ncbi:MAG: FAD:protein FMN transferase [Bifidobacteriaceae bacterium]|jgi:thiamine biosynthesis lipoprotein|nr:FAD:protein FMN transferase [Bifidobacteriaceae bacterium]
MDKPIREFLAMGTLVSIHTHGQIDDQFLDNCEELVCNCEKLWSLYRTDSEINRINQSAPNQPISIDQLTYDLIIKAINFTQSTNQNFQVTIGELSKIWKQAKITQKLPDAKLIQNKTQALLHKPITLTSKNQLIRQANVNLDFGAVAKGYVLDLLLKFFRNAHISALLSLGTSSIGAVNFLDQKPAWKLGIRVPSTQNFQLLGTIKFKDWTVSTSGTYENTFNIKGVNYHHIIDPNTGYPVQNDLIGVSVFSANATMSEAYSTAIAVMGFNSARRLWENSPNFEMILIKRNHEIFLTPKLNRLFKLIDQSFTVKNLNLEKND